uniref:Uncharacterized protein n=1 Tax=Oryza brachyantha TaxID=4533 RepID=J3LP91_ORYBR
MDFRIGDTRRCGLWLRRTDGSFPDPTIIQALISTVTAARVGRWRQPDASTQSLDRHDRHGSQFVPPPTRPPDSYFPATAMPASKEAIEALKDVAIATTDDVNQQPKCAICLDCQDAVTAGWMPHFDSASTGSTVNASCLGKWLRVCMAVAHVPHVLPPNGNDGAGRGRRW